MKKSEKLIPLVFLTISTLFLLYTFYESEIKYGGSEHNYYFVYYLISSLLVICSIASFFISRKKIINISIIFFSSLFALYLVNTFLILKKLNTLQVITNTTNRFQLYTDLKAVEDNISLSMKAQRLDAEDFPLFIFSDISNKKTIHCNENGYFSIFHTDRYGFNNPDAEWEKNEIEFMLVGDSLVHGACVNESDTISGNLKKLIDDRGVLNLGFSGNGPLIQYATLREYLALKKTNRVIWFFNEVNDFTDLAIELENKILLNYLNDRAFTQKLHLRQNEIDEKLKKKLDFLYIKKKKELDRKYRSKTLSFVRLYDLRDFVKKQLLKFSSGPDKLMIDPNILETSTTETPNKILENFSKIINLSNILSEENGTKFYFVFLPGYHRYANESDQNIQSMTYKDAINIVDKLNITIIDINEDLFLRHQNPLLLFPPDFGNIAITHYNELGYNLVSKAILKQINKYEKNSEM